MPNNVVYGRSAFASNYVAPFSADRAVDGQNVPVRRWVGNVPCYLAVQLSDATWINRWIVRNMSTINGWSAPYYSMTSYSFQISQDGINWATVDSVSGNTLPTTDRTFTPVQCRYVRVAVNSGLNINNGVASIVELEVYDVPPTSQYLSNLTISSGTLDPQFGKNTYNYSASVANEVSSIVVTPTAETPSAFGQDASINVAGTIIKSGESVTVPLNVGQNTIDVVVTSAIGGATQKYTIVVTRAANLFLAKVDLAYKGNRFSYNDSITMDHTNINYNVSVSNKANNVILTPYAEDSSVSISITNNSNTQTVASGGASTEVALSVGSNIFDLKVFNTQSSEYREYKITINKEP